MFWVIGTVVLAIIGGIALIVSLDAKESGDARFGGAAVAIIATLVWLAWSFFASIHTVGQRQVGIVYNFSGTITGKVDPGIAFTAPWQHIRKENVGLQRESFALDQANSAVSKDQQPIYANVTINYQVQPAKVVDLYKSVGPAWKVTLLDSRVLQDFKEITSTYTAAEITTKRPELRLQTKDLLSNELARYDITVVDFFITNLDYTRAYSDAINSKNVQVQKSLQAQAKVSQVQAEAEQAITAARGQATANRIRERTLTPAILTQLAIEKLNPSVQTIYVPSGSNFLIPQVGKR